MDFVHVEVQVFAGVGDDHHGIVQYAAGIKHKVLRRVELVSAWIAAGDMNAPAAAADLGAHVLGVHLRAGEQHFGALQIRYGVQRLADADAGGYLIVLDVVKAQYADIRILEQQCADQ